MIHFVFSDKDSRYLFLKFDTEEDEKWLKDNSNPKKQPNLTHHLNIVKSKCLQKNWQGPLEYCDFLVSYVQPSGKRIYYCSIGLWQEIFKFFRDNKVEYDGLEPGFFKRSVVHTFEEFKEIVDSWGLSLDLRPYQYKAAYNILQWKRSVSQLATRAGKTLMAYVIFRYAMEYLGVKKILVIVPAISLVQQMYNDFKEYKEFFKTECIWGGGKLVESSNLTVGTFQSLIKFLEPTVIDSSTKKKKPNTKYNPHFFDNYDCVFVDETHRAACDQIKTIISQPFMKDVIINFGMTGTLPEDRTEERYCVHALIGAKIQEISTAELKKQGYISDIEIFQYRLNYQNTRYQIKNFIRCAEYCLSNYIEVDDPKHKGKKKKLELPKEEQDFLIRNVKEMAYGLQQVKANIYDSDESEIVKDITWMEMLKQLLSDSKGANALLVEKMMVHFMPERINILLNEVLPICDKNTLILCHHTEYTNFVVDKIKEKYSDEKIILKITGSVSEKKREEIKQVLKENNNCILVASYGTMSTGITLANLCYGVFFESFKSGIVNNQSIGRGLGLSKLKDKYRLFDIVDVFNNSITNKFFLQGIAKTKIYRDTFNQHKYSVKNFYLGNKESNYDESFKIAYDNILNENKDKKKEKKKKEKETNQVEDLILDLFK